MSQKPERAMYTDNPLRRLQTKLQGHVPPLLYAFYENGLLEDTKLAEAYENQKEPIPDDVTLTGLQITIRAVDRLAEKGFTFSNLLQYALGSAMDGLDGPYARHLDLASIDGGLKDVLTDRILEFYMAKKIYSKKSESGMTKDDQLKDLMISFVLSTLTKAACEMGGLGSSEGGGGGMMARRVKLFHLLNDIGDHQSGDAKGEYGIQRQINAVVNISHVAALQRINSIKHYKLPRTYWRNYRTNLDSTSSAIELRKYAAVVLLCRKMDIDIVGYLNTIGSDIKFPTLDELMEFGYVCDSIANIEPFIDKALLLANLP